MTDNIKIFKLFEINDKWYYIHSRKKHPIGSITEKNQKNLRQTYSIHCQRRKFIKLDFRKKVISILERMTKIRLEIPLIAKLLEDRNKDFILPMLASFLYYKRNSKNLY
jgi:hypothetical protein